MEQYPAIEPYETGMLDVGDGHRVYWESCGNPEGTPALIVHGGPGSGNSPGSRRNWDPQRYRIIHLDQRHCGRSTPAASDPATPLTANTTRHLIADIEQLREHLGIERWVVYGSSWGTTVALVYAEAHPQRVRALILVYLLLARRGDLRWLYHEVGRYFPEQWQQFRSKVGIGHQDDLLAGYNQLLNESGDANVQREAARAWCDWEDTVRSLEPGWTPSARYQDPDFRMQFARLVTHYFSHDAWLTEDQILDDVHRLAGIPGVIIHGRVDTGNPVDMPWALAQGWPEADLRIMPGVGHTGHPPTLENILAATERFADAK
ncbi:prolyl aminopeptidase [Kitasatospora kifunensis]|uniref:Proline iminopeptidase n=1 Tax=Kitasatospora kifunensis TaxID=58351 RepID=A0A7W7VSS7_KITKI|nr:prolyl aminopeptidase [Kitasatospora kifunensis]MBB4921043.1 proline iminopeptidase [Kitasatospora kifunensis]